MLTTANSRTTFNGRAELETLPVKSFLQKYIQRYSSFISMNNGALSQILDCLSSSNQSILIIFLYDDHDEFSDYFCSCLSNQNIQSIGNKFTLLGWDISEDRYRNILIYTLRDRVPLLPIVEMAQIKKSSAFFLHCIEGDLVICNLMKDVQTFPDFFTSLNCLIDCFFNNNEIPENDIEVNDTCSYVEFQQRMSDSLGDRDYDIFQKHQLNSLKMKIAFALFGLPEESNGTNGYSDKQNEELNKMFEIILKTNNKFSEYESQVVITIIFVCILPLESNNKNNFIHVPVFILRKCLNAINPCRVVIDHTKRVYDSWNEYLDENKLGECWMVVPRNGRYEDDERGRVKLDKIESPACKIGKKILKTADISSTVLGIGSTGVLVASMLPAITLGPAALLGAGIVGAGVGLYSVGRSVHSLIDRSMHQESMNITESEPRSAYLAIAGGAVGIAGSGATTLLSQVAANGRVIGTASRVAVNAIGIANLGINLMAVTNSTYEVFWKWWKDDEPPNSLTVLQLSTSILFFGHAVYNFKTANTIIEESQTSVMKNFKDMMSSNKQRKMLRKLELETIRLNDGNIQNGRADVISSLITIKDKQELFAFLSRSNKKFNEMGIRFSAKNGQIAFNGVPVDLANVVNASKSDFYSFFSNLKSDNIVTRRVVGPSKINFRDVLTPDNIARVEHFLSRIVREKTLHVRIMTVFVEVVDHIIRRNPEFENLMSKYLNTSQIYIEYMKILLEFITKISRGVNETNPNSFSKNTEYYSTKVLEAINEIRRGLSSGINNCLRALMEFMRERIVRLFVEFEENRENLHKTLEETRRTNRIIRCKKCSGLYFVSNI